MIRLFDADSAVMRWAGRHPAASWFIHLALSAAGANLLAAGGSLFGLGLAFLLVAAIGFGAFYLQKEVRDWWKYWRAGTMDESVGGVTRKKDCWGDLVGPVGFLAGVLSAWWWAR